MVVKKKTSTEAAEKSKTPVSKKKDSHGEDDEVLTEVEQAIADLRERAKKDANIDVNKELRKIQDQIADAKGFPRRPVTAISNHGKQKSPRNEESDNDEKHEEEADKDPNAEVKELINKRLTTCMLLALSFESDDGYPIDFYEKLAESGKFEEAVKPFSKVEIRELNQLLKNSKKEASARVKKATKTENNNGDDDGVGVESPQKKSPRKSTKLTK